MKQFKCALFVLLCLAVGLAYAKVRPSETVIRKYSPAPPPDTARGLLGYYYQDGGDGNHFTTLVQSAVYDTAFWINWGGNGPGYGISNDNFSVKWVGMFRVPVSGTYTFNSNADDGFKFVIKDFSKRRAEAGTVVMNNNGACCADFSGTVALEAGKLYPIEIEFFEGGGGANIMYFMWSATGLPKAQVPSSYFYAMQPPEAARPKITPDKGLFENSVDVKLTTTTDGGEIHYTLDGTTPTINSPIYDPLTPIKLTATTTVKAGTWKADMFVSEVSTATLSVMPPALPNVVYVPSAGVYDHPVDVSLSVNVPDVTIYYTTDGSTPSTASALYTGPIHVDSTTRVKAYAIKDGRSPSAVAAGTYTILPSGVSVPVFSVPEGTYAGEQTVAISCTTPGAVIYYALNDAVLNSNSLVYESPIKISTTTTLKAYATADGLADSKSAIATYTIGNDAAVSAPKFSVPPGTYNGIRQVGLFSDTKDAVIHYTTDGTVPDETSTEYYAPIPVKDSLTINAIAFKSGMRPSPVVTGNYIISGEARDTSLINTNLPAPKLSISPNPASAVVRISWTGVITTKDGFRVVITDSKGAVVNTTVVQGGYTYYQFNTNTLAEGIYFVKVQSGNSIAKGKLIVAR